MRGMEVRSGVHDTPPRRVCAGIVDESAWLPALHPSMWGSLHHSLLTLHVIVGGREAMCDNGDNIGGTGIGDCRLRFDVGKTPLIGATRTPIVAPEGLLRVEVRSSSPLDHDGTLALQLARGATLVGCRFVDDDDKVPQRACDGHALSAWMPVVVTVCRRR